MRYHEGKLIRIREIPLAPAGLPQGGRGGGEEEEGQKEASVSFRRHFSAVCSKKSLKFRLTNESGADVPNILICLRKNSIWILRPVNTR